MRRKIMWLVVSGLVVAALVLASCGPAVTEEEEEEVVTEEEEEEVMEEEEEEEEVVEQANYGGMFAFATSQGPQIFDEAQARRHIAQQLNFTNETLLRGDWAKGPAGTSEASWIYTIFPAPDLQTGAVLTHFEMPDPTTQIFHVREGIYWHDKPPADGRELTADDVVFSILRSWNIPTDQSHRLNYPWDTHLESVTATDKNTVVVKYLPGKAGIVFEIIVEHLSVVPVEIADMDGTEWGSEYLKDWKNSIGTGPFMLTDYVQSSSTTFTRNPNYWAKDPVGVGEGNQLPYLDGIQWLVIPDVSTRLSAIRTGKIDWLPGVGWEDADGLLATSPELSNLKYASGYGITLNWRVDQSPFTDIKVRQALSMAVNQSEIAETYYGGNAELLSWPIANILEYREMYTPLDELPEETRELFEYHPDKAKQLLTEAGFPDGFKTSIVCIASQTDLLAIVQDAWADVGVELVLDVKEYGAYNTLLLSKNYEIFMSGQVGYLPFKFFYSRSDSVYNFSQVNDPRIDEAYVLNAEGYFNFPEKSQRMYELSPYMLSQAWQLQLPGADSWAFWQPWVKNYHGEVQVGYNAPWTFTHYIWIDQDLKEEMTGKR
jgi:peptide/nickel transport system substrate-binding protein